MRKANCTKSICVFATVTIVILAVAGCASDSASRYYGEERYAAVDPSGVEILQSSPDRPHVVIADFQARGVGAEFMRKQAAQIGADAIIVSYLGGLRDKNDQWAGQDSQGGSYSRVTGTAIKYK